MTISIPYPLLRRGENEGAADQQLAHRKWLADRILFSADAARLGARFRQVQLVEMIGTPGPSLAVFTFDSVPGLAASTQVINQVPLVKNFVHALTHAREQ